MLGDISDKTRHSIDKQILFNDVVVANLPSISRLPTGDLGICFQNDGSGEKN